VLFTLFINIFIDMDKDFTHFKSINFNVVSLKQGVEYKKYSSQARHLDHVFLRTKVFSIYNKISKATTGRATGSYCLTGMHQYIYKMCNK